jgi:hypothetical protein
MAEHVAQQGECISSIAASYGFSLQRVWKHPNNSRLRELRKNPYVLCPGDVVYVPDKEMRVEDCDTDNRHKFVRKGVPEMLRLVLLDYDGNPRPNINYQLSIDDSIVSGTSDAQGLIECFISPLAKEAKLNLVDENEEYTLSLGYLDPISEITGVQGRLNNLGFGCGALDGVAGSRTASALQQFQEKHDLTVSGEIDDQTRQMLDQVHGS